MTAQAPGMTRLAITRRLPRAGLDGGALSVRAWLLLAATARRLGLAAGEVA